jgi:hypothetical protein
VLEDLLEEAGQQTSGLAVGVGGEVGEGAEDGEGFAGAGLPVGEETAVVALGSREGTAKSWETQSGQSMR